MNASSHLQLTAAKYTHYTCISTRQGHMGTMNMVENGIVLLPISLSLAFREQIVFAYVCACIYVVEDRLG